MSYFHAKELLQTVICVEGFWISIASVESPPFSFMCLARDVFSKSAWVS